MKQCSKCGQVKEESEFFKKSNRKSGFESACKECWKKYYYASTKKATQRYRLQRKELLDSLKTSCAKCGETRKWVIQFHHVDPKSKSFNVSYADGHDESQLRTEVNKCVCLCSNCHDEFHYFYGRNPSFPVEALNEYLGREDTKDKV